MSADSAYLDPYRSPSLPEGPYAGQPLSGRPGKLTALCVLCIVLGALGLMNSLMGAAGALVGAQMQAFFQPKATAGVPAEMQKAQEEFQQEVNDIQGKYMREVVAGIAFRFAAALLLLVGGIRSLSLKESGRKVLLVACAVAIVFELLHAILQSIINMEMMTAVNSYVEGMMASMPQAEMPPGFSKMMQTVVRGSIIGGLIMSYLLVLAKAGLYTFGLVYLRRPAIKALFKPA
jgi:hypothetical protein